MFYGRLLFALCVASCAAHRSGSGAPGKSDLAGPVAGEARCQPTDPGCGPVPFSGRPIEQSLYVADWPRTVHAAGGGDPDPRKGACAHDGECYDSGCGYACLSTRDEQHIWFACVAFPDIAASLRGQFCGCVNSRCSWFAQ